MFIPEFSLFDISYSKEWPVPKHGKHHQWGDNEFTLANITRAKCTQLYTTCSFVMVASITTCSSSRPLTWNQWGLRLAENVEFLTINWSLVHQQVTSTNSWVPSLYKLVIWHLLISDWQNLMVPKHLKTWELVSSASLMMEPIWKPQFQTLHT